MPYFLHICAHGLHGGCYPPQPVSVLGSAPTLSPSFLLAQAILEPNVFPYKYPNILKPSHSSHLPACEDGTECSETSAYKIQTPGNYQEERIQHSKHSESLKSKWISLFLGITVSLYHQILLFQANVVPSSSVAEIYKKNAWLETRRSATQ